MTTNDSNPVGKRLMARLDDPVPPAVGHGARAVFAIDRLDRSMKAWRMALVAADAAFDQPVPVGEGQPSEADQLRARWLAAVQLLTVAFEPAERDATSVIAAVKAILNFE